jgi:hypothetical protein
MTGRARGSAATETVGRSLMGGATLFEPRFHLGQIPNHVAWRKIEATGEFAAAWNQRVMPALNNRVGVRESTVWSRMG